MRYDAQDRLVYVNRCRGMADKITELLGRYADNHVPEQVRAAFGRWINDSRDATEKDEALEHMWDEMVCENVSESAPDFLESACNIIAKAENIESQGASRRRRIRERMVWATGAVAFCMLVLAAYLYISGSNTVTTLASSPGAKAEFTLPDGSHVWLNRGSSITYKGSLNGRKRCVELNGEAFFDVRHVESSPFVVHTRNMDVTVLGTRFTMSAYEDHPVSAYLESGRICVSGKHIPTDILVPDEGCTFDPALSTYSHSKVSASSHISWINDMLTFENTPLSDIVASLEHWYNVSIDNRHTSNDDIRLSLSVRTEPLAEILDAMSRISEIEYSINGNEITIH